MSSIAVIIATKDRPKLLRRALKSIANQTRQPDIIQVISDCDEVNYKLTKKVVEDFQMKLKIELTKNQRTKNLSGAINTGLLNLIKAGFVPEDTYIAVLDDDDTWEPKYLEECEKNATINSSDWVISGIIRHESEKRSGTRLPIPQILKIEDFFISNPHIQGSNLFIKFSTLLKAGGYDEALESTTDRDICIRLLDLPDVKYSVLNKHMVHHYAYPDPLRLSYPGSEKKKNGLIAFFKKYSPRMTKQQRISFKKRAKDMFNCELKDELKEYVKKNTVDSKIIQPKYGGMKIPIIVGFISTRVSSTIALLDDLNSLNNEDSIIAKVVIIENTPKNSTLKGIAEDKKYRNLNVLIIRRDTIEQDFKNGLLGTYFLNEENRKGIPAGRTALHHYLYKEARNIPGSVVWILDDDIRLKYRDLHGKEHRITANQLQSEIQEMKERGVCVGIGEILGDPPLPPLSMLRCQLLDIYANLKRFENSDNISDKRLMKNNIKNMITNVEYYYDYSEKGYCHLETPFWYICQKDYKNAKEKMLEQITSIEIGKSVFRPIYLSPKIDKKDSIIVRGGNTLITNPECLRRFPNIAPSTDNIQFRRGDTLWTIFTKYLDGSIVDHFNIPVTQERNFETMKRPPIDTLLADFYGSAFVKAMDDFYQWKRDIYSTYSKPRLAFNKEDIIWITERFKFYLEKRVNQYILNAYRINGLISILKEYQYTEIQELISNIETLFDITTIQKTIAKARKSRQKEIEQFLQGLKEYTETYRYNLPQKINERDIEYAQERVKEIIGNAELKYLAHGMEGVLFTDNKHIFKYFHRGTLNFYPGQIQFCKEKLEGNDKVKHFARLEKIIQRDGEIIFQVEYIKGHHYDGGKIDEIRKLLRECKQVGIVYNNFHPNNIVVNDGELRICDIGNSIVPFTDQEFREMAKRAYLTYRYHFREDLSEVMSVALHNENIPELYGFKYFWESIEDKTKHELLDEKIINYVISSGGKKVLDYGCGRGSISEALTKKGLEVTGFDINQQLIGRNRKRRTKTRYLGAGELDNIIKKGEKFDTIICNLVLCTIEDNQEANTVLENIRKLIEDNSRVIITICNPFNIEVNETETHKKIFEKKPNYNKQFSYKKRINETNNIRKEVHRPFRQYKRMIESNGFQITKIIEIPTFDRQKLLPASDFIILELKPIKVPGIRDVSLLIKASPMEWKSIDFQIRHIVRQLNTPKQFKEIIIVTDRHQGPFLRQYDKPNITLLRKKLEALKEEGLIDRIVYAPDDKQTIIDTYKKWFNVYSVQTHAENGQPIYTTLYGMDQCSGKYILQMDSDCIIVRNDFNHDYLGDMIKVFEQDPTALTVSFNIAKKESLPYTDGRETSKWRTEVRISLFRKDRLEKALPLPNKLNSDGQVKYTWHRSLDRLISKTRWKSYRGGDSRTFYIHVPNNVKKEINIWYNILKEAERNNIPAIQYDNVNLQGDIRNWLKPRNEEFIYIVRGKNVEVSKIRRAFESIKTQQYNKWGLVIIDAKSDNGMAEYLEEIILPEYKERATFWRNWTPLTPIENMKIAIRELCNNPESVIITLDMDDALIGRKVLNTLKEHYENGADLTVGSMIRTDKHKDYPVNFKNPRMNRGGNVWQHLRTFKKKLFDKIDDAYFKVDGKWIPHTEDWAFMIPIVELAKKPVHIKEYLYFYEPSEEKRTRSIEEREEIIEKILNKPRLKGD